MNDQLVKYIWEQLSLGSNPEMLKDILLSSGWARQDIDQAIAFASMQKSAPKPPGAGPALGGRRKVAVPITSGQTSAAAPLPSNKKTSSPYSIILSALLLISLLTLVGNADSDLQENFSDQSLRLIVSALFALFFMGLAFAFNYLFVIRQQRFQALHLPYYIAAGYLLLRLLLNVSRYILDQNTAYGVYIVLILTIATLTGMVVFVQKYIIHKETKI